MSASLNPVRLNAIKSQTLNIAGIKNLAEKDCRFLSFLIIEKTRMGISEITLKRIFGFSMSKFPPSLLSLNTLAVYCGYESWDKFCLAEYEPFAAEAPSTNCFDNSLIQALIDMEIPVGIIDPQDANLVVLTCNKTFIKTIACNPKQDLKGLSLFRALGLQEDDDKSNLLIKACQKAIGIRSKVHMLPFECSKPSPVFYNRQSNWWDIEITPVVTDGFVKFLVARIYDITDKVLLRDDIEQAIMKELTMAEDLAVTNVKLNRALTDLEESHRELLQTKTQLEELTLNLEKHVAERTKLFMESESRQRILIENAPVAIAILKGPDHIIETANQQIISCWGKNTDVLGQPLAVALPELEGQPFIAILDEVRRSGIAYVNAELQSVLKFDGVMQTRYFDMIYQPIQHLPGITDCIFIIATDITDHVMARLKLEQSEAMLRLALSAVRIGSWSFDLVTRKLNYNPIYAEILGWDKDEPLSNELVLGQVPGEYREKLKMVATAAIANGTDYDFKYAFKRFNDGRIIWLSGTGKISPVIDGENRIFSGIIREVPCDTADQKSNMLPHFYRTN